MVLKYAGWSINTSMYWQISCGIAQKDLGCAEMREAGVFLPLLAVASCFDGVLRLSQWATIGADVLSLLFALRRHSAHAHELPDVP